MSFNEAKYEVLRVSKKQKIIIFNYQINVQVLAVKVNIKYLGLIITNKLSGKPHIVSRCQEASQKVNRLKRSLPYPATKFKITNYLTTI